jgi:hypothetical protein
LVLIQIKNKDKGIIEKGIFYEIDFSPNGYFLRYFVEPSGLLRVFQINGLQLSHSLGIDVDLIDSWSRDSNSFLYGRRDFLGGDAEIEIFDF